MLTNIAFVELIYRLVYIIHYKLFLLQKEANNNIVHLVGSGKLIIAMNIFVRPDILDM